MHVIMASNSHPNSHHTTCSIIIMVYKNKCDFHIRVANFNTGAIVGGVVGGLLPLGIALILIFLVILLLLKKKSEHCVLLMNAHTI